MHLHLREGDMMPHVLADSARRFARAIIMPNLKLPVTSPDQALEYRRSIINNLPDNICRQSHFQPLMTLYLHEEMAVDDINVAGKTEHIYAVKYYPAGGTTNSSHGVVDIKKTYPVLEAMAARGLPLLVHGEVTDPQVDIFDREAVFIERVLAPLIRDMPGLRIVFEHITTKEAVDFVNDTPVNLAATITPQHLLLNRNNLFAGGLRPHHYCLPVLKAEQHRAAIVSAATSDNGKFFLGTDSAPHAREHKESSCGCAGIYSAHSALELYTEVFEQADCLNKLEAFASHHGADFYGLPRNQDTITLKKERWEIPDILYFGDSELVPLGAGRQCSWKIQC